MGNKWRRFTEKVRESTGLGSKGLEPTSNARCSATLKEATDFAQHLKKCQRAIEGMKTATESLIQTSALVLSAPMPQAYNPAGPGAGTVQQCIGGANFLADPLSRLSLSSSKRLDEEVITPISRWLEVYNALSGRFKELDALRLEVDSRRHTVHDLSMSVDKQRAKAAGGGAGDAKQQLAMEDTVKRLQHKEAKLAQCLHSFEQTESRLYADLAELVKDAEWLRQYLACAMTLQGETLTSAAKSIAGSEQTEFSPPPLDMPPAAIYTAPLPTQSGGISPAVAPPARVPDEQVEWGIAYSDIDLGKSR